MDPKATLKSILEAAEAIRRTRDAMDAAQEAGDYDGDGNSNWIGAVDDQARAGEELAEHVLNLRDWIAKGGFVPDLAEVLK